MEIVSKPCQDRSIPVPSPGHSTNEKKENIVRQMEYTKKHFKKINRTVITVISLVAETNVRASKMHWKKKNSFLNNPAVYGKEKLICKNKIIHANAVSSADKIFCYLWKLRQHLKKTTTFLLLLFLLLSSLLLLLLQNWQIFFLR